MLIFRVLFRLHTELPRSRVLLFIIIQVFLRLFDDVIMPPVYAPDVALALLLLSSSEATHHVHVAKVLSVGALSFHFHVRLSLLTIVFDDLSHAVVVVVDLIGCRELIERS